MSESVSGGRRGLRFARSGRAVAGLAILICVILAAIFAPWLAPHDPLEQNLLARRQPPSPQHTLGLDELGRDNLSRILYGARLSLRVGVTSVLLAVTVGGSLGAVAGYRGGWFDSLTMSVMDVTQAIPSLLLAMVVVVILGRGLTNVLYAVAIAAIPVYARLMRVSVLTVRERDYVVAARTIGVRSHRLLWRHILPACLIPLLVQATLGVGTAILEVAGLSFLGLGAQPPTPEWGAMLSQGRGAVFAAPHIVWFPGLAIMVTVLGFTLLGDGLQDVLDPRSEL
ncbi:ABC transporter permease [Chloroflexota bacterium]